MVHLKEQDVTEMIHHAQEEAPLEACGILAGSPGRVAKLYRATNADHSPVSYRLQPEEQYRIFRAIERQGWDIVGIYHSHPASPALPSDVDLEKAYYPEALYFVVSLADPAQPRVRAFRIAEGKSAEEKIEID
jgi:proteasome lid subunit RPN8/RPN11